MDRRFPQASKRAPAITTTEVVPLRREIDIYEEGIEVSYLFVSCLKSKRKEGFGVQMIMRVHKKLDRILLLLVTNYVITTPS